MNDELIKSEASFSFRFEGGNEIDSSLLAKTITDMAELTKIAAKEKNPEAYIKMNVTAFRSGSFIIDFSTICEVQETLFDNIEVVAGIALAIVGTVKGCFEIKKFLKGKQPESVEKQDDGTILLIDKSDNKLIAPEASGLILNNVKADQLIINIANYTREHNPEGGFALSTEQGELVCDSSDVHQISKALPVVEKTACQRTQVRTRLTIKKPDIMGRSAWDFYYNEKRIPANINDDDWLERLHNREFPIGYNDTIDANLEIYVDLDIMGIPVEGSERYAVTKVFGDIIYMPEQTTMR